VLNTSSATRLADLRLSGGMLQDWIANPYEDDCFNDDRHRDRLKHMTEEFYNKTQHAVVTPQNTDKFIDTHRAWSTHHNVTLQWDFL
jgi:hypothetical protein